MRKFIQDAVDAGAAPRRTAGDSLILKQGGAYRVLVNGGGSLSKAGRIYQDITSTTLPIDSWEQNQTPVRNGNVESIKLRSGKEKVVRTFDPTADEGRGEYRYSAIGKRYYSQKRTEYTVRVPAAFSGTRSNGQPYDRNGFYPMHEPVSVPVTFTRVQRDARIKLQLMNMFHANGGILAEYSE